MSDMRARRVGLALVGCFFCLVGSLLNSFMMVSGLGTGAGTWVWAIIALLLGTDTAFLVCTYWMGMRRGGTNWSTWVVPLCLVSIASILPVLFMALYWNWGAGSFGRMRFQQLPIVLFTSMLSYSISIGTFASTFCLASRCLGVYLVPIDLDSQQTRELNRGSQLVLWTTVSITCCLMMTSYLSTSRMYPIFLMYSAVQTGSQALIWAGIAALVAHRKTGIAWGGVLSLVLSFALSALMYWLVSMSSQRRFLQMDWFATAFFGSSIATAAMSLKWFLCHWTFVLFGYRLRTRRQLQDLVAAAHASSSEDPAVVAIPDSEPDVEKPVWEII